MMQRPLSSTLFPYTTLFRSSASRGFRASRCAASCGPRTMTVPASSPAAKTCCWRSAVPGIGRAHAELQSRRDLVCRLLLEKKNKNHGGEAFSKYHYVRSEEH